MPRPNASRWMTDELEGFRRHVRAFVQETFVPRQPAWRAGRGPDAGAWTAAGAAGLLAPDIPEADGGRGGTFAHQAVVLEELARAGVNFGAAVQAIVAQYVLTYGTEEQRRGWLPRFATGELVAAIAMTEPGAGSDLQAIATRAVPDGRRSSPTARGPISSAWRRARAIRRGPAPSRCSSSTRAASPVFVPDRRSRRSASTIRTRPTWRSTASACPRRRSPAAGPVADSCR
jgi:alkylation response protein AidB-like acyl-CoA dehydrogenase